MRLRYCDIQGVTYSPHEKVIVSVVERGGIRFWDAKTGARQAMRKPQTAGTRLCAVAYSPSGRWPVAPGTPSNFGALSSTPRGGSRNPSRKVNVSARVLLTPEEKRSFCLSNQSLSVWEFHIGKINEEKWLGFLPKQPISCSQDSPRTPKTGCGQKERS